MLGFCGQLIVTDPPSGLSNQVVRGHRWHVHYVSTRHAAFTGVHLAFAHAELYLAQGRLVAWCTDRMEVACLGVGRGEAWASCFRTRGAGRPHFCASLNCLQPRGVLARAYRGRECLTDACRGCA